MFISFCGHDGCGKTTQAELLKNKLSEIHEVVSFPGYRPSIYHSKIKTKCGNCKNVYDAFPEEIRSVVLLYDLWNNVRRYILPNLEKNKIVITERYYESSFIYAPLLGCDEEYINNVIKFFPKPDVYVYLSIDPEESMQRVNKRGKELSAKESLEMMTGVDELFVKFMKEYDMDYIKIDVNGRDPEDISAEIEDRIMKRMENE